MKTRSPESSPTRCWPMWTRIFLFLLIPACDKSTKPEPVYVYEPPAAESDGWQVGSLADAGMDEAPIVRLMEVLHSRDDHLYHSLLIVRNGVLVLEEYFSGYDMDFLGGGTGSTFRNFNSQTMHYQASVTKSVTSILYGIAVDQGLAPNPDSTLYSTQPELGDVLTGTKRQITIKHMLGMCSGLAWDDATYPGTDPRSDVYQFMTHGDPIRYVLGKPMQTAPGTAFNYNSGTTNVVGDIVRVKSELALAEFARLNLFQPLGIQTYGWMTCIYATQVTFASGGLYLRPRDMAKIGQLYLDKGMWKGQRIVSAEWVQASTEQTIAVTGSMGPSLHSYGYGYQWWLQRYNSGALEAFAACGWGNQYIVVLPGVEMVVVFTGGAYETNSSLMFSSLIQDYILAAVR